MTFLDSFKDGLKIFILALLVLSITACSGPMVNFGVSTDNRLNPNKKGKSTSVVIRVYQLTDKGEFERATFSELWKNDEGALGKTLLTRNEVVLNPESNTKVNVSRHEEAKYVGVVALFRNPIERRWRGVRQLSQDWVSVKFDANYSVNLVGNTLYIND